MHSTSRQTFFIIFILLVIGFVVYTSLDSSFFQKEPQNTVDIPEQKVSKVKIGNSPEISVIVADTEATRQQGLSGMKSLELNTGMLFVFEEPGRHNFWMKDMHFPIDIIWISETDTVVHVERNISPDTFPQLFSSSHNALYVVEVPAGFADKYGIDISDQVSFL